MSAGSCSSCPECGLARALEGFGLSGVVRRLAAGAREMAGQSSGAPPEAEALLGRALAEYAEALEFSARVLEKHGVVALGEIDE